MWGGSNPGWRLDSQRLLKRTALCIILLLLSPITLFAGEWRVQPTLKVAETYSDNIGLRPQNSAQTEFVTQINPGISVHGKGGRIKLDFDYSLQNLIYATDGNLNETHHQLSANGNVELVKNLFFLDARSSISQQIINSEGRVGLDNLNVGNRGNVISYGLSPYLKLRLSTYVEGQLKFSDDHVQNQSGTISDAESQQYNAHLNSGRSFARLKWSADFNQRDLLRSNSGDSHYESAMASVSYNLFSDWSLLAHGGYEDNNLPNVIDPHNGSYWSAGLEWAPSAHVIVSATTGENNWDASVSINPTERTSLHVDYRDRKIGLNRGSSWNALLTHRTRQTTWQASYTEEVTTDQILQLSGQQYFVLVDNLGNPIIDPTTGLPVVLVQNIFSLTNQDFIRKRGQLAVTMNTGKSNIVLSIFNEQRIYSLTNGSEDVVGTTASWTWRFKPRTNATISTGWQRRNPVNTINHDDTWNAGIAITRNVSKNIHTSLEYSHLQHNTPTPFGDYAENRVSAQLNMRF